MRRYTTAYKKRIVVNGALTLLVSSLSLNVSGESETLACIETAKGGLAVNIVEC